MKQSGGEKRCPKCGRTMGLDAFHRNYATADGYQTWCKDCHKASMKANQLRNRMRHLGEIKDAGNE